MTSRRPIGNRNFRASFSVHDGSRDSYGQRTYDNADDYTVVVADWPCEVITTVGNEVIRGKMVTEKSTHVLYGELFAVQGVDAKAQVTIDGVRYGIEAGPIDPDGRRMEARFEIREIINES